jgi:hypothetical protein
MMKTNQTQTTYVSWPATHPASRGGCHATGDKINEFQERRKMGRTDIFLQRILKRRRRALRRFGLPVSCQKRARIEDPEVFFFYLPKRKRLRIEQGMTVYSLSGPTVSRDMPLLSCFKLTRQRLTTFFVRSLTGTSHAFGDLNDYGFRQWGYHV